MKRSLLLFLVTLSSTSYANINFYTVDEVAGCETKKTFPMITVFSMGFTADDGRPEYQVKASNIAMDLGANAVVGVNISNLPGKYAMHGTPVVLECVESYE